MKLANTTSLFAFLAAGVIGIGAATAQTVGTAGAVNPDAQGAPPGGTMRTMNVGGNVVHRQRITTSDKGSVQLVFVDRTTMNIGPNSQLVIDEFVYDPNANTGRMAATLTKGVLRFVGGQTSHTGGATIKTPATTLGVRGGVATIRHDLSAGTRVINHFGIIQAQTPGGTEIIRRPGFALNVANPQAAPTPPLRAARTEIAGNNTQLTSRPGQTGGRRETPTDQGASRAVGQANAPVTPTLVLGQQQQNTAQQAQVSSQPNTMTQEVPLQQVQQVAQQGSQGSTEQVLPTLPGVVETPVTPTPTPTPTAPVPRSYALAGGPTSGAVIPSAFRSSGTWYDSAVVGYGTGGINSPTPNAVVAPTDNSFNTTSRIMAAGMVISGQGAAQSSSIYLMNADMFPEAGTKVPGGGIVATTRLGANQGMGRLTSALTPTVGGLVMDADYSPASLTANQIATDQNGRVPGSQGMYYTGGTSPSVDYNYEVSATRGTAPTGLGAYRPVTKLSGFAGGLMRTDSRSLAQFNGQSFGVNGAVTIDLTSSSRFGATFVTVRSTGAASGADDYVAGVTKFGYQGGSSQSQSTYVDYDYFGARTSRTAFVGSSDSSLSTVSRKSGSSSVSAAPTAETGLMVNSKSVGAQGYFPGVAFCQCDYTRWGFWSLDTRRDGQYANGSPDTVRDRVHMGTWVAGQVTPAAQVPTTGTATFSGHAIGSMKSGQNEYIAAGNFAAAVNFGTNSSTFAISNLDGASYSGTASLSRGSSSVLMSGSGISPGRFISVNGQFMNGVAGPAHEMGGGFSISGTNYVGSGTFAAKR